jgi:hypothetical protein
MPGRGTRNPSTPVPEEHPGFATVTNKIDTSAKSVTRHPSPRSEAAAAQKAAKPPADDKESQAKAAKADKMEATKPGTFDKAAFIAAVNQAVAAQAPKNLDEADKFSTSGKSDAIASTVMGKVSKGKEDSAKPLAEASNATPDTSKAVEKPVAPVVRQLAEEFLAVADGGADEFVDDAADRALDCLEDCLDLVGDAAEAQQAG